MARLVSLIHASRQQRDRATSGGRDELEVGVLLHTAREHERRQADGDVHESADLLDEPEVLDAVAADRLGRWVQEDRLAQLRRHREELVGARRVEVLATYAGVDDQPDEPTVLHRLCGLVEQRGVAERVGVGVGGQPRSVLAHRL